MDSSHWSRSLQASVLDSTPDLIWTVDHRHFGLQGWNAAFHEYYRVERHIEVEVGMLPEGLFPPGSEYLALWLALYRRVLETGPFSQTYETFTKTRVLDLNFGILTEGRNPSGIAVFGKDITAQVRARERLEESEARFRALFDKSADAIFLLTTDGIIERANQTACQRLQYTQPELVGRPVSEFHPSERAGEVFPILRALSESGTIQTEIVHLAKDGTRIPTEINSHVIEFGGQKHILTTARDISDRLRAETDLRDGQARYQDLFENSGTANVLFNRDLRVVLANRRAAQLLGVPATALVGKTAVEVLGPDWGRSLAARTDAIVQSGTSETLSFEVALPGGGRWFQTSYNPQFDESGVMIGLLVISLDVTELHHANEKLRQNDKLESIGVLAGGIAHDFNNLLAGLVGHLDLARLHLKEGRQAEALARLDKSSQVFDRAKSLTRQLLTFSKGGAPVRELAILGPLLKDWAEFALSGSDASLVLEVAPDLWLCECDAPQIAQVVDNLLINARQSTAPGGTVWLRAENCDRSGPFVAISVTDQGPGMAPETLERIFDPFFTTKAQGSGLGLATSRSIVVQHGGTIEVETAVGRGSTFTIFLPALPGRRAARVPPQYTEFTGSGRALIMDDEESVRDTVGELLGIFGLEVTRARNGHDALAFEQKAREEGRPFGLVLLDLTIPGGMGGLETALRLRAQGSTAKLLAMSGYSEQSGRTNLQEGGFLGILTKPFSRRELSTTLRRILA